MKNLKRLFCSLTLTLFIAGSLLAQGYQFKDVVRNSVTPVKNQGSSGTCWAYATIGFLEAELLRTGKGEHHLSEMFIVRENYLKRMSDNYYKRGKGNLGQGSLTHMVTSVVKEIGIVPLEAYPGINYDSPVNNHKELNRFVNLIGNAAVEFKERSPQYEKLVNSLFDIYLGELPQKFTYQGKEYTPQSFREWSGLDMDNYVKLTSFTHIPLYEQSLLAIPDNWNHERFYNVTLDELMATIDNALHKGYTVCWDGDVSERGFSHANGVAINPEVEQVGESLGSDRERFEKLSTEDRYAEIFKFEKIYPEVEVTPEIRQKGYEDFTTTDDHLMLLTGIVKDQLGNHYYITKNSWGTARNKMGGYLNMSESYVKAKTIYILVHKESIPKEIRAKLGL